MSCVELVRVELLNVVPASLSSSTGLRGAGSSYLSWVASAATSVG